MLTWHTNSNIPFLGLLGLYFFKLDGSCCLSPSDQIPQVILTKHQVGKCQNRFHYRLSRSALSMAHHEIKTRTEFSHVGSTEEDAACINEVCSIFVIIEDIPRFSFYVHKSAQFFSLFLDRSDVLFAVPKKKAVQEIPVINLNWASPKIEPLWGISTIEQLSNQFCQSSVPFRPC